MKMADIEIVIKISEKVYNALTHSEFDANLVVDEMRKSIANGTQMVLCKDCKHYRKIEDHSGICAVLAREEKMPDDWFCAGGERRDPCSSQDS